MTRRGIALIAMLAIFTVGLGMVANAAEEAWSPEMNQASYWSARLGADCTKFENHSRFIPAVYDIAIVHDGQRVAIYDPAPDNTVVASPINPNNGKPYQEPGEPSSWVMKCIRTTTTTPPSTSTTEPEPTTTTVAEQTTTTGPGSESTTTSATTVPDPTTTTITPTTTSSSDTPTTSGGSSATTTPQTPPVTTPTADPEIAELPYTGPLPVMATILVASALVGGGWSLIRRGSVT